MAGDAVYYPAPAVDMRILVGDGGMFDLMRPSPDDVSLAVIARALSQLCRYGGHTSRFYSVAEHSLVLATWFAGRGETLLARYALMHDAAEAYVGDLVRPLKRALPYHETVERGVRRVIFRRLGLHMSGDIPAAVQDADTRIIRDEIAALIPAATWSGPDVEPLGVQLLDLAPDVAFTSFMNAGKTLFGDAWQ